MSSDIGTNPPTSIPPFLITSSSPVLAPSPGIIVPNINYGVKYFAINSVEDWHKAIVLSQDPNFNINIYDLKKDLVFDLSNQVYIKTGLLDEHYFLLRKNQQFRGNGFNIGLYAGAFGGRNEANGIFRCQGTASEPSIITDLTLNVKDASVMEGGAILCSSISNMDPTNIKITNLKLRFHGYLEEGGALLVNHQSIPPQNVSFQTVVIEINEIISLGGNYWFGFLRKATGDVNFMDCSVISAYFATPTEIDFSLFLGIIENGRVTLQRVFTELPNQGGALFFIGQAGYQSKVQCLDLYARVGTAYGLYDGMVYVLGKANRESMVDIYNYYSNANLPNTVDGVILQNGGSVRLENINNRYDFANPDKRTPAPDGPTRRPDNKPFIPTHPPFFEKKKKNKMPDSVKITLIVIGSFLGLLMLFTIIYYVYKMSKKTTTKPSRLIQIINKPDSPGSKQPTKIIRRISFKK